MQTLVIIYKCFCVSESKIILSCSEWMNIGHLMTIKTSEEWNMVCESKGSFDVVNKNTMNENVFTIRFCLQRVAIAR